MLRVRAGELFPAPLPQESAVCSRVAGMFYVLGVFLAKTLQDSRLVNLPMSPAFLKPCVGERCLAMSGRGVWL